MTLGNMRAYIRPADDARQMRQACVVGLCCALTIAFVIGSQEASAQICVSQAPRYLLTSDTVDWSIQVASGQSCVRGLRWGNIVLERVSLTTPPKSGTKPDHSPKIGQCTVGRPWISLYSKSRVSRRRLVQCRGVGACGQGSRNFYNPRSCLGQRMNV